VIKRITIAMEDMLPTLSTMVFPKDSSEKRTSHGLVKTQLAQILRTQKDKTVIRLF